MTLGAELTRIVAIQTDLASDLDPSRVMHLVAQRLRELIADADTAMYAVKMRRKSVGDGRPGVPPAARLS